MGLIYALIVQRKDMALLKLELGFESLWGYKNLKKKVGKFKHF